MRFDLFPTFFNKSRVYNEISEIEYIIRCFNMLSHTTSTSTLHLSWQLGDKSR
jgi:hypothetical protein